MQIVRRVSIQFRMMHPEHAVTKLQLQRPGETSIESQTSDLYRREGKESENSNNRISKMNVKETTMVRDQAKLKPQRWWKRAAWQYHTSHLRSEVEIELLSSKEEVSSTLGRSGDRVKHFIQYSMLDKFLGMFSLIQF